MTRKSMLGISVLALAVSAVTPAYAQTAENDADATSLGEIIVTAQKRSQRLQDVPLSVTALSAQQLERTPIHTIADIQTAVPGLNISGRNNSGVVAIRGIGFDIFTAGAEGGVAVHSDGIYASRPMLALSGLYDVERIEVARGPQGTLYGRNSTGGALNIVSRKPSRELNGYVDFSFGNYDAISIQGAVSGPVVEDKVFFRIAAKSDQRSGYGKNLYNDREVDDLNTRAIRAQLEIAPSDRVNFLLSADYFKEKDSAGSSAIHTIGCIAPTCNANVATNFGYTFPSNIRDIDQDIHPENVQEHKTVSLTSKFDLGFADLTSITAYRKGHSYFIFDLDMAAMPGTFLTREEDHHEFSQEIQLGKTTGKLDWLLGAFYFYEKNDARANGHFPTFFTTLSQYFQGGVVKTDAKAVFGQATYHLTDFLAATVGARYSEEKKTILGEHIFTNGPVNWVSRGAAPTASDPCVTCKNLPESAKFSSFTPKFGLELRFNRDMLLYATVQKGFKSGGFAVGAVQDAFKPEYIWSYEAGLKAKWLDGRAITNISAFHYDYSDLQVGYLPPNSTSTAVANAGTAKVDGVEMEANFRISDAFSVDVNGSYINARFTDYLAPANPALNTAPARLQLKGNLLSNAPKFTARLGAQYEVPAFGGTLTARAEAFFSSRVYFTVYNDLFNSQKPYDLEKASLRWEADGGRWFLSAYVNNIANKTVGAASGVRTATVGRLIAVDLMPPRTYGIGAGIKF